MCCLVYVTRSDSYSCSQIRLAKWANCPSYSTYTHQRPRPSAASFYVRLFISTSSLYTQIMRGQMWQNMEPRCRKMAPVQALQNWPEESLSSSMFAHSCYNNMLQDAAEKLDGTWEVEGITKSFVDYVFDTPSALKSDLGTCFRFSSVGAS